MKKLFLLFIAALLLGLTASASAEGFTREDGTGGNVMLRNRKVVALGTYPGSVGSVTIPYITMVDLTQGAPVVMVAVSSTTAGNGIVVSGTATLGDKNVIGIVNMPAGTTTASALSVVQVASTGVVLGRSGTDMTKGQTLCASSVAGKLTPCAAVTEGIATQISRTAVVAIALETKTATGAGVYGLVLVK